MEGRSCMASSMGSSISLSPSTKAAAREVPHSTLEDCRVSFFSRRVGSTLSLYSGIVVSSRTSIWSLLFLGLYCMASTPLDW